jgi:transcriptional regulator with XRE-family HTH domain
MRPARAGDAEYRSAHGLTQVQLARLLKVDQSYVSKIERGHRVVRDVGFVRQIAQLLDVPLDEPPPRCRAELAGMHVSSMRLTDPGKLCPA